MSPVLGCGWPETSWLVPFWLKAIFLIAPQAGCMEVVVYGNYPLIEGPGATGIPWSLGVLLCLTFLCGCCCGRILRWPATRDRVDHRLALAVVNDLEPVLSAWDRLVRRALKFVARRRRIGLAFASYRDCTLRNTPPSRPTQARVARRRVASRGPPVGIPPLQEGPALTSHGSDRNRVGNHQ